MNKKSTIVILIISIIWWLFPDFIPGPIDDLVAVVVTVSQAVKLCAKETKEAQDAVALLSSPSKTSRN